MIATYANFVWSCYIITAVGLVLNIWLARRSLTRELKNAKRRQQMQSGEGQ
jgi:heme exporter protein CcmD